MSESNTIDFVNVTQYMHSELTTDVSILNANLNETIDTNRENVVLIKTGAFNPIQCAYVANMIKTKEYLERVR